MFLNDISSVEACVVLPQLSDHCPTLLSLNIQPPKQQVARRSFLDIKYADFCGLNRCLAELDWSPVLDVDNPDTAVQIWNEIFSVAMHKFIPEKQVSTRSQNKPWYSPHLCRIRRQRDRLYKRSKNRTTDHHLSVLYRRVRNWYVAELRYAEKLYYRRISLTALTTNEVFERLSKLHTLKAPGADGVSHHILKSCAHAIAEPLCHIFNLSLRTGIFPRNWKTARIEPIYKNKGERSDPQNYRPIALLLLLAPAHEFAQHMHMKIETHAHAHTHVEKTPEARM